jgi:hypothetical protein
MKYPDCLYRFWRSGLTLTSIVASVLMIGVLSANEQGAGGDRSKGQAASQVAAEGGTARKNGLAESTKKTDATVGRPATGTQRPVPVPKKDARVVAAQAQPAPARDFSPEFRESLRRTNELRRQRRGTREQGAASDGRSPGAVVPWPMPPSLIVKQTPQVHDEISSFLRLLRR